MDQKEPQITQLTEGDAKELGQRIFDTYDQNKSRVIEDAEIAEMMKEIYKLFILNFAFLQ